MRQDSFETKRDSLLFLMLNQWCTHANRNSLAVSERTCEGISPTVILPYTRQEPSEPAQLTITDEKREDGKQSVKQEQDGASSPQPARASQFSEMSLDGEQEDKGEEEDDDCSYWTESEADSEDTESRFGESRIVKGITKVNPIVQ